MVTTKAAEDLVQIINPQKRDLGTTVLEVGQSLRELFVGELAGLPKIFWEEIQAIDLDGIKGAFLELLDRVSDKAGLPQPEEDAIASHFENMGVKIELGNPESWEEWLADVRETLDTIFSDYPVTFFDTRVVCGFSANDLSGKVDKLSRGGYDAVGGGGVRFLKQKGGNVVDNPSLCAILQSKTEENN